MSVSWMWHPQSASVPVEIPPKAAISVGSAVGAGLDTSDTRRARRMTAAAPESRSGVQNHRFGQLCAKGKSPQSLTWSRSEGGTR